MQRIDNLVGSDWFTQYFFIVMRKDRTINGRVILDVNEQPIITAWDRMNACELFIPLRQ